METQVRSNRLSIDKHLVELHPTSDRSMFSANFQSTDRFNSQSKSRDIESVLSPQSKKKMVRH